MNAHQAAEAIVTRLRSRRDVLAARWPMFAVLSQHETLSQRRPGDGPTLRIAVSVGDKPGDPTLTPRSPLCTADVHIEDVVDGLRFTARIVASWFDVDQKLYDAEYVTSYNDADALAAALHAAEDMLRWLSLDASVLRSRAQKLDEPCAEEAP